MAKSGKLKRSKFSKGFGKAMSVVLCAALLITTYTGFFAGFGAAASAIEQFGPGEVGLSKTVVQQDDTALVTVKTKAKQFEEDVVKTSVVKQTLDVVIIIDTSGSMSSKSEGATIMDSVKQAAIDLANSVYELNSDNRVGLVSFAQNGYAYSPNQSNGVVFTSMTGSTNYWFTASQKSSLSSRINSLTANGGTNSEGGLLTAEKVINSTDDGRNKLVVFMTDGLPTGRYKDNGSAVNSVATYDGSGCGVPSYDELAEMLAAAQSISGGEKAQLATVFYSGGLTDSYYQTNGMSTAGYTAYYPGCTSSTCRCNSASSNHGQIAIVAPGSEQSEAQKLMSGFYHKYDLGSAQYIVNDLLQPYCEAGVYMPSNASEMLRAFQDIITSYTQKNFYAPATNAYYEEIIPDYLEVDEDSIEVSMGSAELLRNVDTEANGKHFSRDVIRWTIGSIPEETQTMTYALKVKDERVYGIMDVTMQGILRYNEVEGFTKTPSPLIVQIDEMILAPEGENDYFAVDQDKVLEGNVLTSSKNNNILINTTGNADDASNIVNGYAAGLNGDQTGVVLSGMVPVITEQPAWGTVNLNEDGTFTYVPGSEIYSEKTRDFESDPNANDAYNAVTNGWEDSFKYVITTEGTPTAVNLLTESYIYAQEENKYINDKYWNIACDFMGDTAVAYENGNRAIGHQKIFCGSEACNVIYVDNGVPYDMEHIKRGSGGTNRKCVLFTDDTYTVQRDVSTVRPGDYIYWETITGSTIWHHKGVVVRPQEYETSGSTPSGSSAGLPSGSSVGSDNGSENSAFAPLTFTGIDSIYNDKINVLVFENMTQNGADSEGRVLVGGNFSTNGFSASQIDMYTDQYAMMVGGNVSYDNQWTLNICKNPVLTWDGKPNELLVSNQQWIKDYAAAAQSAYGQLSIYYAGIAPNGITEPGYVLRADPNHVSGTPHVFYIDGSKAFGQMFFTGTFGDDPIIVNIAGNNVSVSNGDINVKDSDLSVGKLAQQTVFNFFEANTITSSSISFQGSILAPYATFTYSNGHVEGSVIVKNLVGAGSAQYNTGWNLYGIPVYFKEGTNYTILTSTGEDLVTTETSEPVIVGTEVTETEISTDFDKYTVTPAGVYNAEEALQSEEVTVYIRIRPDFKNLTATKSSKPESGTTVKAGDEITYVINAVNPRPADAQGVKIIDTVPSGTTLKDAGGAVASGDRLEWTVDIPARSSQSVSFTVTVNSDIAGTNNLANVAYVEFTTPGKEESTTVNTNTVAHAYISAVKSSDVPAETILDAGDTIVYTITVANNGSANASDIAVSDKLPAGLTFVGGENVTCENGTVTAVIPVLAAGEKAHVTFSCTVNEFDTGVVAYQNTAYVNDIATNTVENTAQRGSVTVSYIDKDTGEELADTLSEYGRTGSAYGPYEPAEITNYRHVATEGSVTGTFTGGNTEVTFQYERIPGTASIRYVDTEGRQLAAPQTVNGWQGDRIDVGYGKEDKIGNYSYQYTDATGDALTEAGVVITHIYKLDVDTTLPTVIKTSDPAEGATVQAGGYITYYIDVTNNKYEAMNNVAVTDTVPAGMTLIDAGGAADNGTSLEWIVPVIEPGETARVSFTAQVNFNNTETGLLTNTANVSYVEREASTSTEVGSNTVTHGLLVFEKYTSENARGYYGVGDSITYFIKVRNIGSATATAEVADTVPAGTVLSTGSTEAVLTLEPGAEQIVSFTAKISDIDTYEANITNTAYVNGTATNTTTDTVKKAALVVRYEDEEGNTLVGSNYYTGTPGDEHPSTAPVTVPGYTFSRQEGATDGLFAADTTLEVVNIYVKTPASATVLYMNKDTSTELLPRETISGFVGDELTDVLYKDIENYRFVETDLSDGTILNEDGVTVIHYYRFIKPDATLPELVKTADPADGSYVRPGQQVTYTLRFINTRIDPINELVITDVIPAGSSFVDASEGAEVSDGVIAWNIGTVEPGSVTVVSFTVKADEDMSGSGNLGNVAKAVYSNRDFEPEVGVGSNKVGFPVITGKLEHYNNQSKAILTHGDEITYVVTAGNIGSADAVRVPVISYVPEGTTFKGSDDFALNEDGTVSAVVSRIEPGDKVELSFTVTVDTFSKDVYSKDIPNNAKVNGIITNPVLDIPKAGNVIIQHVDYDGSVIKTESIIGERINTPYGPYSDLVTEGELENRRFVSVDEPTSGRVIEGTVVITFTYDRVPAVLTVRYLETGTEEQIKAPEVIDGFWQGGDIPEQYAKGGEIEGYLYDRTDAPEEMKFDTTGVVIDNYYTRILNTDIPTVKKTSIPASGSLVRTADEIQYTIEVTNVRAVDALAETVVTDKIPAGTYYIDGSASDGGEYDKDSGTITWNLGSIPAGETRTVKFGVKVINHPIGTGLLANTAVCGYTDLQTEESHEVPSNTTTHALIVSSKTSSESIDKVLSDGSRIVYTVTATNAGSAPAPVSFSDVIPDGVTVDLSRLPEDVKVENDTVKYNVDSLAPGASASLVFEAIVNLNGRYSMNILNVAQVNGEDTSTVANIAKRGEVEVSYVYQAPDGTRSALPGGEKVSGRVGDNVLLADINSYENLRYLDTEATAEYNVFAEGLIKVVHVFESIPTRATILYKDIDNERELAAGKVIDLYAGDKLPETYVVSVENYEYVGCDAPTELTVGENGLTITHYYKEIPDVTELVRVKSAVPAENTAVMPGDTVEYTITVTNPRREEINNVTVTDTVPAGTELLDSGAAQVSGDTLVWVIENLQPGESAQFGFTVTVSGTFNEESDNLTNRADVVYTNRTEDTETVLHTNTVRHPVLTAVKTVDKTTANTMADLLYTVTVTNEGTVDAENVIVTDAIPEGTELVEVPEGAVLEDGVLTFAIARIAAGESKDVSFTVNVGTLETGVYRKTVSNTAQVNGHDTNKVDTAVTQGEFTNSYVDENGVMLREDERLTGSVGDEIIAAPADIEGYELVSTEGTAEGEFIEGMQYVTFVYKRMPSTVKITYVDRTTGEQIASPVTYVPEEEPEEEETDVPEAYEVIRGYTYQTTDNVSYEDGEIVHYYEPVENVYKVSGKVNLSMVLDAYEEYEEGKGVEDLTVTLFDRNEAVVDRSVTDRDGNFKFEDVPAGQYTVVLGESDMYEPDQKVTDLTVVEDTSVVMKVKTRVLGASDVNSGESAPKTTEQYVNNVQTIKSYEPVAVTETQNAVYTKVLGDTDTPNTGDNDMATAAALVIAAAALFVLILTGKHS